jgi:putative hydrolase of the HAD superfamily
MRAVCFDLDGTLLEMRQSIPAAIAAAFDDVAGECRDARADTYNDAFLERFRDCEPEPYRHGARSVVESTAFDGSVGDRRDALLRAEVESLAPTPEAEATLARWPTTRATASAL